MKYITLIIALFFISCKQIIVLDKEFIKDNYHRGYSGMLPSLPSFYADDYYLITKMDTAFYDSINGITQYTQEGYDCSESDFNKFNIGDTIGIKILGIPFMSLEN